MQIIDDFLRRFRTNRRNDPVFGPMRYMGDRVKYWECKLAFAPTASTIEVFVDGSAEENMETQHKFFAQFVQWWPTLSEPIGRMLLEKWRERKSNALAQSPWEFLKLSSLSIPSGSIEDAK